MSGIKVEHLFKRYESGGDVREILKDVSLTVFGGKSAAIMGPSGSGKTTLLNILGTLDTPTSGTVDLFGTNPFALNASALARFRNETIGFIFQSHHLLPQCSVLENVLLPTVVNGGKAEALKGEGSLKRAQRLLDRVGLTSRLHDRPARLSGGERQRAAVVRALINGPKVLLADEPTGSLDQGSAETIAALLSELKREEKVALVVVTHTLEVARKMDLILELKEGALVAQK